jgi:hypothetical protein
MRTVTDFGQLNILWISSAAYAKFYDSLKCLIWSKLLCFSKGELFSDHTLGET